MPWKTMRREEQRIQFVIRATSGKERLAALCREFGISRPTGYLWRRRYQSSGTLTELAEHSRRPHGSPSRTATWKAERVAALRQQTGWGAKKLRVLLGEEEIVLPVRTIHRILQRQDFVSDSAPTPALTRFERSDPNELWQMDSKGKYSTEQGECHPLSILDDHSRYVVGLYALPNLEGEKASPCLVETFRRYGVPQAMLMDRGSLWWTAFNGWGLTRLSVQLIEQGIRLLYGRVRHPQTQGKVERFHRTLGVELRHRGVPRSWAEWPAALAAVREIYNEAAAARGAVDAASGAMLPAEPAPVCRAGEGMGVPGGQRCAALELERNADRPGTAVVCMRSSGGLPRARGVLRLETIGQLPTHVHS